MGRRVRRALIELRAVAAAGERHGSGGGGGGGGRSVEWLAEVAQEGLLFAQARSSELNNQLFHRKALDSVATQGGNGGSAAAAPGSAPASPQGSEAGRFAVRWSYAAAELLPAMSLGVEVCAELHREAARAGGEGRAGGQKSLAVGLAKLHTLLHCTSVVLANTALLLSAHSLAAAGAGQAAGGGPSSTVDTPWRQLLLRDMRLMQLLGAEVALCAAVEVQDTHVWKDGTPQPMVVLREALSVALPLAAAAFPAEFRAAVDWTGTGTGAVAAGVRGAAGSFPAPCIPLPAVQSVLGDEVVKDQLALVTCVLGGLDPPPRQLWGVACDLWSRYGAKLGRLEGMVGLLLPPEQARAAMAAAAAAAAAAQGAA